jgi:hypothetical protein
MKTRGKIITGIIVVVVVAGYIYILPFLMVDVTGPYQAQRIVTRVLSKTDHQALLKAGREVLSQMPRMENKTPDGSMVHGSVEIPKEIPLPQALRALSAHHIVVNSYGYMHISMHAAMDHFGFYIYPEDFNAPDPGFKYGDRQIIDGLWYYDDGYHYPDGSSCSEYAKRINDLLANNKYRK